jgi:glycosyltransferase involved in cell wall biosynthesis
MHVYLFSPIPFSFLHQRPQKIAEELCRQSVSVTFIEPYGFTEIVAGRKRLKLRDIVDCIFYHVLALLDLAFGRTPAIPSGHSASVPPAYPLEIRTFPLIVPSNRLNSAFLDKLNRAVQRAWLAREIGEKRKAGEAVALVQQPYLGSVLRKGDFDRIFYDCIDDLSVFSGRGSLARLSAYENSLLAIADAVFVTSEALHEQIRRKVPGVGVVRVPNGVDYERFQGVAAGSPVPPELQAVRKPIAGYVGILRVWFDAPLMEALVRQHPDVTFVLVGPYDHTAGLRRLMESPNVILTGRKPYDEIPAYVRSFDVCLIPFRQGEIAETTNPVKAFEYFALGKPVVSTWLRELIPYAERGLLRMTKTREEFSSSLRDMLEGKGRGREEERRAVARENSWTNHVRRMTATMQTEESR